MSRIHAHVFRNDLLQRCGKQLPFEHLQIFLDVARFRIGKIHDPLEEGFQPGTILRDGGGLESFQISTNPVLLFHLKLGVYQPLEEVDDINGSDEEAVRLLAIYAGDDDVCGAVLLLLDWLTGYLQQMAVLFSLETDEATAHLEVRVTPVLADAIERCEQLEGRLLSKAIAEAFRLPRAHQGLRLVPAGLLLMAWSRRCYGILNDVRWRGKAVEAMLQWGGRTADGPR
jgi:hypothetical protein